MHKPIAHSDYICPFNGRQSSLSFRRNAIGCFAHNLQSVYDSICQQRIIIKILACLALKELTGKPGIFQHIAQARGIAFSQVAHR